MTTTRDGPSWHKVFKRDTYDLHSGELLASEEVNDENRSRPMGWNNRMPGGMRATRAVLHYREPDKHKMKADDADYLKEMGNEYN